MIASTLGSIAQDAMQRRFCRRRPRLRCLTERRLHSASTEKASQQIPKGLHALNAFNARSQGIPRSHALHKRLDGATTENGDSNLCVTRTNCCFMRPSVFAFTNGNTKLLCVDMQWYH
eukprot:4590439-Pleurochrysis_carterae.AAC.2